MELKENLLGMDHVGIPTADLEKSIAFYESNEATGKPGAIDHLALKARDIEAAFKAVKALGYEMVNDEIEFLPFWENGVRFFTFYGPNREKIEFSQMQ